MSIKEFVLDLSLVTIGGWLILLTCMSSCGGSVEYVDNKLCVSCDGILSCSSIEQPVCAVKVDVKKHI